MNIPEENRAGNKYLKKIRSEFVDVYDVLEAYNVRCPALQHSLKKLLMAGHRGYKGTLKDLTEALESLERGIELQKERDKYYE